MNGKYVVHAFALFFFVIGFAVGALFNPAPTRVIIESAPLSPAPKPEPEPVRNVMVAYEVEYGSIYTGDQTPIVYRGEKELTVSSLGIGTNGLPIEYLFPVEARVVFDMNGRKAVLHIPTVSDVVTGFIRIDDTDQFHLMTVEVTRRPDNVMVVRAAPRS
ncbi:MAG: hypothetical protein Q8P88_00760 [Candidatus Jorgensenbacteria bacterium]|nr:hypothetical protein [Candidatus Jorgensenbacteria bacterium]